MTLATTLATLTGLTVSGVTRSYTYQPTQINSADLPCLIPAQPTTGAAVSAFSGATGLRTHNVTLVIIVEPTQQGTASAKWTAVIGLMDALHTALETVVDSYTARVEETVLGETPYWAIVAEVEVSE